MAPRRGLQRLILIELAACALLAAASVFVARQFAVHPLRPASGVPIQSATASRTLPLTEIPTPVAVTVSPTALSPEPSTVPAPVATADPALLFVSADGDNLRLREQPGTFGRILSLLGAGTPLTLVGRSADSGWLEVDLADGRHGWVLAEFVDAPGGVAWAPITGQALIPPVSYPDYISGLDDHTRQIFLAGQALGNRPDVFSKVGDSITVSPDFLIAIGQGQAVLRDFANLQPAIDYFSATTARDGNSFLNTSLAAKNGWSAWTVLDANYRDPALCLPNESPLRCEYRLVKPSLALIMFGTNDAVNSTPAAFQANLSTIVQTSIDLGVIPVLSTIPERLLGDIPASQVTQFNDIIPVVARAYDVPLWDYRATLAGLPHQGIGDTVHPSSPPNGNAADFSAENLRYGYPVRNLGALQVLNAIWRNIIAPQ